MSSPRHEARSDRMHADDGGAACKRVRRWEREGAAMGERVIGE
jgi:hypothetical protein